MVSIGSKALPLRRPKNCNFVDDGSMGQEENKRGRRKEGMSRKSTKEQMGFGGGRSRRDISGRRTLKHKNDSDKNTFVPQTSFVRKQVDPETAKYFSEIANLFEGNEVDLEERLVICGNALEETRGKELELATDYIISHTLQTLLEVCDVDHLCRFLQRCAKDFCYVAMDRSGSHVAETALKSLALHLQDSDTRPIIEETLTKICQAIVVNPVELMCNCYGSHVVRRLLCLCKGISLDSSESRNTKSTMVLAERLNFRAPQLGENNLPSIHQGFPDLLKFLICEMLKCTREDILTLQVEQYSSLVLQTVMKLLVGQDQVLMHVITIILGCNKENFDDGDAIDITVVREIRDLMKETASSHLMEVILEVAPDRLYDELFTKVFRSSLFEISSDHCGNFVVQALVSRLRSKDQMDILWEELGLRFQDLLEMGRSGVIASIVAASQRLHTHEKQCCQALAAAVCSDNESPICIVPRILYLESYFCSENKSNWNWASGVKTHVIGSLILQAVFRYQSDFVKSFVNSLTSMEVGHVLDIVKDGGGARVVEAFLNSDAPGRQKRKLVVKLRGHFGELSMHSSSSFTVEKCFNVSNVALKEAIVSELSTLRTELSKTKQGPHLLRKLDVDGFASGPDQWRSRQASKQSALKEFYAVFGSNETKTSKRKSFLAETSKPASDRKSLKMMREEIDHSLAASAVSSLGSQNATHEISRTKLGVSGLKCNLEREKGGQKVAKLAMVDDVSTRKITELKKKQKHGGKDGTSGAGEATKIGV